MKTKLYHACAGVVLRHWNGKELGKSSESVQCAMLRACDACADMGQL